MIWNIVDHRKRSHYQWARVWGVAEPTWHDNSVKGATQAPRDAKAPSCKDTGPMALAEILRWAMDFPHAMTLYLYDEDPMRPAERRKRRPPPQPPAVEHRHEAAFGKPFTVYGSAGPYRPTNPCDEANDPA